MSYPDSFTCLDCGRKHQLDEPRRIQKPGVYALTAEEYHADPVAEPSLSSSICKILLERSPRHAWLAHPRLNPHCEPIRKMQFDLGAAAHAVLLEGAAGLAVIEAEDYKTKSAREARDAAYAAGKIPVLARQADEVEAMVWAARRQLAAHSEAREAFDPALGKPEQTLVWREGDVWCRARLDWLPAGGNVFFDYKTTGASANPEQWGQRQLFDTGCDIQAAFYRRGIKAALGIEGAHFRFVVQETEPPYALSVVSLTPAALDMADRKVAEAIALWRWCLKRNRWPGYPSRVCYVDPPPWHERRWLEREERALLASDAGEDLRRMMIEWQAPLSGVAE